MIFIEKIKNIDCDNEGIFYTSKYPLISVDLILIIILLKMNLKK